MKNELYRLEFTMLGLPKMTNGKRSYGHWSQFHREASKWKRSMLPYISTKKPKEPLVHAKLTLTRGSAVEPDYDGLVSGFKHVLDGLVEGKILEDDSREHIGIPDYRWELAPMKQGFVRVVVEEVLVPYDL